MCPFVALLLSDFLIMGEDHVLKRACCWKYVILHLEKSDWETLELSSKNGAGGRMWEYGKQWWLNIFIYICRKETWKLSQLYPAELEVQERPCADFPSLQVFLTWAQSRHRWSLVKEHDLHCERLDPPRNQCNIVKQLSPPKVKKTLDRNLMLAKN